MNPLARRNRVDGFSLDRNDSDKSGLVSMNHSINEVWHSELDIMKSPFSAMPDNSFLFCDTIGGQSSDDRAWQDSTCIFLTWSQLDLEVVHQAQLDISDTRVFSGGFGGRCPVEIEMDQYDISEALCYSMIRPKPELTYAACHPLSELARVDALGFVSLCCLAQWCSLRGNYHVQDVAHHIFTRPLLEIPTNFSPYRCTYREGFFAITVQPGLGPNLPSPVCIPSSLVGLTILPGHQQAICETRFWSKSFSSGHKNPVFRHVGLSSDRLFLPQLEGKFSIPETLNRDKALAEIKEGILLTLNLMGVDIVGSVQDQIDRGEIARLNAGLDLLSFFSYPDVRLRILQSVKRKCFLSSPLDLALNKACMGLIRSLVGSRRLSIPAHLLTLGFFVASFAGPRELICVLLSIWSNWGWSHSHLQAIVSHYDDWCNVAKLISKRSNRIWSDSVSGGLISNDLWGILMSLTTRDGMVAFPVGGESSRVFTPILEGEIEVDQSIINCLSTESIEGAIFPSFPSNYFPPKRAFRDVYPVVGAHLEGLRHLAAASPLVANFKDNHDVHLYPPLSMNPNINNVMQSVTGRCPLVLTGRYDPRVENWHKKKLYCSLENGEWQSYGADEAVFRPVAKRLKCRVMDLGGYQPPANADSFEVEPLTMDHLDPVASAIILFGESSQHSRAVTVSKEQQREFVLSWNRFMIGQMNQYRSW